jgi:hypothetical protein
MSAIWLLAESKMNKKYIGLKLLVRLILLTVMFLPTTIILYVSPSGGTLTASAILGLDPLNKNRVAPIILAKAGHQK